MISYRIIQYDYLSFIIILTEHLVRIRLYMIVSAMLTI